MQRRRYLLLTAILWAPAARGHVAPAADHPQHLFSPGAGAMLRPGSTDLAARDLVALLDSAGIRRALILSVA